MCCTVVPPLFAAVPPSDVCGQQIYYPVEREITIILRLSSSSPGMGRRRSGEREKSAREGEPSQCALMSLGTYLSMLCS